MNRIKRTVISIILGVSLAVSTVLCSGIGYTVKADPTPNVSIPVQIKFDAAPPADVVGQELQFKLTPVSGTTAGGAAVPLESMPMPTTDVATVSCPSAAGTVGYDMASTPWKFSIGTAGSYQYKVSFISDGSCFNPMEDKIIPIIVQPDAQGVLTAYYQSKKKVSDLKESDFAMTLGTDGNIPGVPSKAQYSVSDGVAKLTIGGSEPNVKDAFDSAAVKSTFSIDFSRDFIMKGKVAMAIVPDGAAIGFVPNGTPQSQAQVHKWWLNGVFGGGLGSAGDAPVAVNGNGVFIEFDSWGNYEGGSSAGKADEDNYLRTNYSMGNALSGKHINLLRTDANGKPIANASNIVVTQSLVNIPTDEWPNTDTDYIISYSKDTKKLNFKVGSKVDLTWNDPVSVFGTTTAYLVMGANVRFGSIGSSGVVAGVCDKTTLSFEEFNYTDELITTVDVVYSPICNTSSTILFDPVVTASAPGTTSVDAAYGAALTNITPPTTERDFLGYYDDNGTQYYNATGIGVKAWDKRFKNYTLKAHYKDIRSTTNVVVTKDGVPVSECVFGDSVSLSVDPAPTDTTDIVYKYCAKGAGIASAQPWNGSESLPAGEYDIYAVIAATDSYSQYITEPASLNVKKASNEAVVKMDDYTWGQDPLPTPETDPSLLKGGAVPTYYYNDTDSNTGGTPWSSVTSNTSIDAGTYYMYASIPAVSNYDSFTTPTVQFTVSPKEAKPVIVVNVKKDGTVEETMTKEIDDPLVLGTHYERDVDVQDTATSKVYEITYTFKGNYTGKITKKLTVSKKTPQQEEPVKEDDNITTGVEVADVIAEKYSPEMNPLTDKQAKTVIESELSKETELSDERKQELINGLEDKESSTTCDAYVYIKMSDATAESIGVSAKEVITGKAEELGIAEENIKYFDISLFTTYTIRENGNVVFESNEQIVTDTNNITEEIDISIPDELRLPAGSNKIRTFYAVRAHKNSDGIMEESIVGGPTTGNTLTIKTNKFSPYALMYKDTNKPAPDPGPGDDPSPSGSGQQNVQAAPPQVIVMAPGIVSPKTGDTMEIVIYGVILLAGIVLMVVAIKRRDVGNIV